MSVMTQMKALVEFLGKALGELYEITLFDFSGGDPRIAAIANPTLSNRDLNSPPTDVMADYINHDSWRSAPSLLHVPCAEVNGQRRTSSTYFISEGDTLVGALSIVFNEQAVLNVSSSVLNLFGSAFTAPAQAVAPETLWRTPDDIAHHAVCNILKSESIPQNMTQAEKQELVQKLRTNGVFRIKGAVSAVAALLSCSEPTIYRYLSQAPKAQKD